MKILHIIPTLGGGGAERFVVDLVNELAITHEVCLCTLYALDRDEYRFFRDELSDRVKHVSLNKQPGLDVVLFKSIHKLLTQLKPDVVNTHLASINYVLPSAFFSKRTRFFHTIHSDAVFEIKHPLELKTRKAFYRRGKIQPITISEQSQKSFRKLYQLNNDVLIQNGRKLQEGNPSDDVYHEVQSYKLSPDTLVLLNVGRFVALKRQFLLANIVDELVADGHDLSLLFIGDYNNDEGKGIKENIKHLSNNRIHLLGPKNNVLDYLACADAFCIASDNEGLPISLLEALSKGCIPISTPVGGMTNIVTSNIGFLAKDLSKDAYKVALLDYISSLDKASIKKNCAKLFADQFNINITKDLYLRIYDGGSDHQEKDYTTETN